MKKSIHLTNPFFRTIFVPEKLTTRLFIDILISTVQQTKKRRSGVDGRQAVHPSPRGSTPRRTTQGSVSLPGRRFFVRPAWPAGWLAATGAAQLPPPGTLARWQPASPVPQASPQGLLLLQVFVYYSAYSILVKLKSLGTVRYELHWIPSLNKSWLSAAHVFTFTAGNPMGSAQGHKRISVSSFGYSYSILVNFM